MKKINSVVSYSSFLTSNQLFEISGSLNLLNLIGPVQFALFNFNSRLSHVISCNFFSLFQLVAQQRTPHSDWPPGSSPSIDWLRGWCENPKRLRAPDTSTTEFGVWGLVVISQTSVFLFFLGASSICQLFSFLI